MDKFTIYYNLIDCKRIEIYPHNSTFYLGVNPFAMLPRSLTENGKYGKIIGAKDLFCSCFELSSDVIGVGRNLTKSVTMPAKDYNAGSEENDKVSLVDDELAVVQRRAISLINPPTSIINNLALVESDMPKSA